MSQVLGRRAVQQSTFLLLLLLLLLGDQHRCGLAAHTLEQRAAVCPQVPTLHQRADQRVTLRGVPESAEELVVLQPVRDVLEPDRGERAVAPRV